MASKVDQAPQAAGLTPSRGDGRPMNTHRFERVEGRTYSVCTVCGVLMRTAAENDAAPCIPKAQPIREDDPKLSVRVKPFGK